MGRSGLSIPFSGPPLCGFPLSGSSQVSPLGGGWGAGLIHGDRKTLCWGVTWLLSCLSFPSVGCWK